MADNDKAGGPAVWLVAGSEGEYEYFREWLVDAHTTADSAAARVKAIERVGVELAAAMTIAGFGREDLLPDGWIANYAGKCGDAEWTPDARYEVRRVTLVGHRGPDDNPTAPTAAADLARAVMAWWAEHQYDTSGERGEWNVYDTVPDFVRDAAAVLGVET